MAKIKYDVSDVETGPDFDTPIPVGVYRCKINDVKEGTSKSSIERGSPEEMLTVEYEIIQKGDWKGRRLWDYIVLNDASAWKLQQFVSALGKRAKGTLDTNATIGEKVLVRVKHETDNRDPDNPITRARVGSTSEIPSTGEEEEEPEDEEVEDDAEEEEVDVEEDDDEEGVDEDLTYEDLEDYDREDLETLIEDEELELKFNKRTKDDVLRERVAEALGLESEEEDEDDEEDEEDEADYEEMSIADLKTELKSRGLNEKGKKASLIKRLEKDDEDGNEPF